MADKSNGFPSGVPGPAGAPGLAGVSVVICDTVAMQSYPTSDIGYLPLSTDDVIEWSEIIQSAGDYSFDLIYAMSVDDAGDVELQVDYLILQDGDSPSTAWTAQASFTFAPGAGTTRKTLAKTADATMTIAVEAGDELRIRVTRKDNMAGDNHPGTFNFIRHNVYLDAA